MKFPAIMFLLWIALEVFCMIGILFNMFMGKETITLWVIAVFAVANQIYYKLELKE